MSGTQRNDVEAPVIRRMEERFDAISADMLRRSRDAVPDYAAFDDPAFVAAAKAHCDDHLHAFLTVARERRLLEREELAFVTRQAAMRARQGVPLDALLHVYRMGHDAIFRAIREAGGSTPAGMEGALALTGRTLAHVDLITTLFTEGYLETQQELREGTDRARRDLFDDALRGALEPGPDADERARSVGIDPAAAFVVIVCRSPSSEALPGIARRLTGGRVVAATREREVLAVAHTRDPAAVRRLVEEAIAASSAEAAAGVSLPCAGLVELQRGHGEARAVLRHAAPGEVVSLGELSTSEYLAMTADNTARRLVDPTLAEALARDREDGGGLIATVIAYAAADQSAAAAARSLHVHANTVHYRLAKLNRETGRDPHRFHDLAEMVTAIRILGLAD